MESRETTIREAFNEAASLPASQWPVFLEQRCPDPVVRDRVRTLLDALARSEKFLSRPAIGRSRAAEGTVGEYVAEFRILREIGRGGMGVVYLAHDTVLERLVAIKILPSNEQSVEAAARLHTEAKAAARLSHPNIVQVYRFAEEGELRYIVMEYVEGETLREWFLRQGATPGPKSTEAGRDYIAECSRFVAEAAEALEHAHRAGVIHRDIKPSNIMIDRASHARLADFGVARILTELSVSGGTDIAGSFPYMSPEQARVRQHEVDQRSDVFSLGVVLYELLAKRRPFEGTTPADVVRALSEIEAAPLRRINPAVKVDLATICHKAIEKEPSDRYQTAAHMAADLYCCIEGKPILASPLSLTRRIRRFLWRQRAASVTVVVLMLAAVIAVLVLDRIAASEKSLAWINVSSAAKDCVMVVQPVDPETLLLRMPIRELPLGAENEFSFEPGHYRFTIVQSEHEPERFCEVDLLLHQTGREAITKLVVLEDSVLTPDVVGHLAVLSLTSTVAPTGMARVSSGRYQCGPGVGRGVILERKVVDLLAFDIDLREVSNKEYLKFLLETAPNSSVRLKLEKVLAGIELDAVDGSPSADHHPHIPAYWRVYGYDRSMDDCPVVGIRLRDAEAFARWNGKRLPTMFEWDAAACYTNGQPADSRMDYPGGKTKHDFASLAPDAETLRREQSRYADTRLETYRRLAQSVYAPDENATALGIAWMFGNAAEIVSTVDLKDGGGVAKGRSWLNDPEFWTLSQVSTFPLEAQYFNRGFRCARSVEPLRFRQH